MAFRFWSPAQSVGYAALDMKLVPSLEIHREDVQLAIYAANDFGVVHRETLLHDAKITVNNVLSGIR